MKYDEMPIEEQEGLKESLIDLLLKGSRDNDYSVENDSIGSYECGGASCYDNQPDYISGGVSIYISFDEIVKKGLTIELIKEMLDLSNEDIQEIIEKIAVEETSYAFNREFDDFFYIVYEEKKIVKLGISFTAEGDTDHFAPDGPDEPDDFDIDEEYHTNSWLNRVNPY